jgi:CheY-like chemotaxis protein
MELAIELLSDVGIEVDTASNGLIGVQKINENKYDLVLMDIQMPELDGLSATREIRRQEKFASLPILAMTAHAMKGEYEKSIAAGMNDHITKPIDPHVLYTSIIKFTKGVNFERTKTEDAQSSSVESPFIINGLDVNQGIARVAGKISSYEKLLTNFVSSYSDFSVKCDALVKEKNSHELSAYLHTVAGVSGNIGANAIYTKIREASVISKECAEKNSALNDEFVKELIAIGSEFDLLIKEINAHTNVSSETLTDKEEISPEKWREIVDQIVLLAEENDVDSAALCEELITKYTLDKETKDSLIKAKDSLNNFDFDDAIEIIKQINK